MIAMPDIRRELGDQILRVIRDAFDRYHRRSRSDQPHAIAAPSINDIFLPSATIQASDQPLLPPFVAPEDAFTGLLNIGGPIYHPNLDADAFMHGPNFNFDFVDGNEG